MGIFYHSTGSHFEDAQQLFESTSVQYPDYPGIYVLLGNRSLGENRHTEALLLYEKAKTCIPGKNWQPFQKQAFLEQIHLGIATIYQNRKKWEQAVKELEALLKIKPKDGALQQRLAIARFLNLNRENTYKELQEAKQNNPDLTPPEFTMVQLYTSINDTVEARKWILETLKNNIKNAQVYYQVAEWLWQAQEMKRAEDVLDQILQWEPEKWEANFLLGLIHQEQKNYPMAEKLFSEMHQKNPSSFGASNQLILTLIEQSEPIKKQKALELASINAQLYPDNVNAVATLGWVYFRLEQIEEAKRIFEMIVNSKKFTPEIAYYLANISFHLKQFQDVYTWLELANTSTTHFIYRKDVANWLQRLKADPK